MKLVAVERSGLLLFVLWFSVIGSGGSGGGGGSRGSCGIPLLKKWGVTLLEKWGVTLLEKWRWSVVSGGSEVRR